MGRVRMATNALRTWKRKIRQTALTMRLSSISFSFKVAIDLLCQPRPARAPGGRAKRGLGFLVDDAPRYVEIASWWERARRGEGLGLLELWSGVS